MPAPVIMLVDNGSMRAAATLSLRTIASALSDACGRPVHPVSLQHAHRIPAGELEGRPAAVLADFLRAQLGAGRREFVVVPVFFGRSRALTAFIPQQVASLGETFGAFEVRQADVLSPLPLGEPRLADILADQVAVCSEELGRRPTRVIVVDHGSPLPEVTAVRSKAAAALARRFGHGVAVEEAVMERRPGPEYAFNGPLLADLLRARAADDPGAVVALAMLFVSPGRHAGPGGDIAEICREVQAANPRLRIGISPLVGEHPLLIEILADRLQAVL